jgi:hypothetical protein
VIRTNQDGTPNHDRADRGTDEHAGERMPLASIGDLEANHAIE